MNEYCPFLRGNCKRGTCKFWDFEKHDCQIKIFIDKKEAQQK